jgi:Tfp pilus assembly protein PilZ
MILTKKPENRVFPRVDLDSPIRFQVRGSPDFGNAVCNDISAGGLRFTSNQFVPTESALMLEIKLLERVLRPIGKVAWSAPVAHSSRNQLGVEFLEFDMLERNYLKEFINMRVAA